MILLELILQTQTTGVYGKFGRRQDLDVEKTMSSLFCYSLTQGVS